MASAAALVLSAPVLAETVTIPGPEAPLAAELTQAENAAHAIVIVPGSGPIDRDGNAPQMGLASDSYKLLAEGLAAQGITALRIDKRGFFGSAEAIADPNDVTIAAYASDVQGWVGYAQDLAPCVWIAGHSEGGLVALVAAAAQPDGLCGVILLATPGRPIGQLLVEQFAANPMNGPLMPDLRAIVADLEQGKTREPSEIPPLLQPFFTPGLQRFMMDVFSYDPAEVAAGWAGLVLILQGDADFQVKPMDADLLQAALPQAERVDLTGGGQMLKTVVPGDPFATYRDPSHPLHAALLPGIAEFLERHRPTD